MAQTRARRSLDEEVAACGLRASGIGHRASGIGLRASDCGTQLAAHSLPRCSKGYQQKGHCTDDGGLQQSNSGLFGPS